MRTSVQCAEVCRRMMLKRCLYTCTLFSKHLETYGNSTLLHKLHLHVSVAYSVWKTLNIYTVGTIMMSHSAFFFPGITHIHKVVTKNWVVNCFPSTAWLVMWMANFHVQTVDTRYGQTYNLCLLVHHTPKVPGDVLDRNLFVWDRNNYCGMSPW